MAMSRYPLAAMVILCGKHGFGVLVDAKKAKREGTTHKLKSSPRIQAVKKPSACGRYYDGSQCTDSCRAFLGTHGERDAHECAHEHSFIAKPLAKTTMCPSNSKWSDTSSCFAKHYNFMNPKYLGTLANKYPAHFKEGAAVLSIGHHYLFNEEHGVVMSYSEKAGCTTAVSIFFSAIGQLKAALDFNKWIHNYRDTIYQRKQKHGKISDYANKVWFKVVRNPFSRALSIYKHAVSRVWHIYEPDTFEHKRAKHDRTMYTKKMGRGGLYIPPTNDVLFGRNVTFERFVDYLSKGGTRDNPHFGQQLTTEDAWLMRTLDIKFTVCKLEAEKNSDGTENTFEQCLQQVSALVKHNKRESADDDTELMRPNNKKVLNLTTELPKFALEDNEMIKDHHAKHKGYGRYMGNVPYHELPHPFPRTEDMFNTRLAEKVYWQCVACTGL
jgi:hypothetical protein